MKRRPAVISYDISDPKCRKQALQLVRGWRVDGQKSVHECWLSPQEAQVLYAKLCALIDPQTDHVLLAWVNQRETPLGLGVGRVDRLFCHLIRVT